MLNKRGILLLSLCGLIPLFFLPSFSLAAWSDHDTGCYFRAPITSTQTANYTHDWYHTESYDFDQMILGDVNQKRTFNSNPSYTLNGNTVILFFYSTIGGYWQSAALPSVELDGGAYSQLIGIEEWSGTSTTLNAEYPNGCEDLPVPCEDELAQALSDCGDIEFIVWDDLENCIYHCSQCDDNIAEAEANCGAGNYQFDQATCDYICNDCTTQHAAAVIDCEPYGIDWYDYDICNYACLADCDGTFENCYDSCWAKNGIYKYKCTETDIPGEESKLQCICNDDIPDTDPPPDEDPPPDNDPSPDPNPDPSPDPNPDPVDPDDDTGWLKGIKANTDDLVDLADERNNDWLDAMKENQDVQITQLDDSLGYQKHISEGTDTMITNQGIINATLKANGQKLDNLKLDADLTKLEDNTTAIKDSLNVDDNFASTFQNELDSSLAADKATQTSDMQNAIGDILDEYGGVEPDDAGFFSSLFLSIVPPSSTCQPLDMSFKDKEIIIGCEYSDEIKQVMSYFIYIITVLTIFTLVRRELIPKTSA